MKITGREVPNLLSDLEEVGPLINDIFFGCSAPLTPLEPRSVVFVGPEQDIINGGFYSSVNIELSNATRHASDNLTAQYLTTTNDHTINDDKWQNDCIFTANDNPENIHESNFNIAVSRPANSDHLSSNAFERELFYTKVQKTDDLLEHSNSNDLPGLTTSHFSQLVLREPTFRSESANLTIPESEASFCASYSAPGSALSSDWSTAASDHSSAQSQDEILEEIQRECAEIERKSASPASQSRQGIAKKQHKRLVSKTSLATSLGNSERKKELNRIAATKYREKKRRERDVLGVEHAQLEARNVELRSTMKDLKTEVAYLRKLMKDMEARSRQ